MLRGTAILLTVSVLAGAAAAQGGHCGGCGGRGPSHSASIRGFQWGGEEDELSCHLEGRLGGLGFHADGETLSEDQRRAMEELMRGTLSRIDDVLSEEVPEGYSYGGRYCGGSCPDYPAGGSAESQLRHRFAWERGPERGGWTVCHHYGPGYTLGLHLGRLELSDETSGRLETILEDASAGMESILQEDTGEE